MQTNPFATEAAEYAHLRPTYPDYLFEFLATILASRNIAWDCATGKGQAATHLAREPIPAEAGPAIGGMDALLLRLRIAPLRLRRVDLVKKRVIQRIPLQVNA
jgi:hypothetical protein